MRFDLLDEYSTLVPFGLGESRRGVSHDPAVPAKADNRAATENLAGKPELRRKLPGALRQMALSSYRNLAAKCACLF
jgi:hypothetical protein